MFLQFWSDVNDSLNSSSSLGINSLVSVSKLIEDLLKDEKEFTKNQHQILVLELESGNHYL
jgi:hypothetical protein